MSTDRESQLLRQATKAGIDSPLELANFMAQAGHESRGLSRLNESFNFTRESRRSRWRLRGAMATPRWRAPARKRCVVARKTWLS